MTKGARKTGGARERSAHQVVRRRKRRRSVKRTVLVVGEGRETEPNYFHGLKREDSVLAGFSVTVKKGPGVSPEKVVERTIHLKRQAENRREAYDEVWCVLDVEDPTRRDSLDKAVTIAAQNGITLCLSNPCFEVWLLSHFQRKGRAYKDCDAAIVDLNKHWQKHCGQDYRKNDDQVYDRVSGLTERAVANAQWVRETYHCGKAQTADCNSSTDVYRLVGHLKGCGGLDKPMLDSP